MNSFIRSAKFARRAAQLGAVLSVTLLGFGVAGAALPSGWSWYHNARFTYSTCYPVGLFRPGREPENGDGVSFASPSGARLSVWGAYDVENLGLHEQVKSDMEELIGGTITYSIAKPTLAAVSGVKNGRIFYWKHLLRNDIISTIAISYPLSLKQQFAPIVDQMSRCFTAGDPDAREWHYGGIYRGQNQ